MGHPLTAMFEAYSEKLLKRRKYLKNRIHFLDTLPQNRFPTDFFPNTFSYRTTFQEMTDIDDMLSDIREFLDRYIDDICCVCGEIIGHDPYEHHHISYYPELIIPVHHKCHQKIHYTDLYTHLKPPVGDSKDFYNGVEKPAKWMESGIPGTELKVTYSAIASCWPKPNLNWNRAAKTEIDIKYDIVHRKKVTKPRT